MTEPRIYGAAPCKREGCPGDSHDITWIKDDEGYVVSTMFTCRVCGFGVLWVSDEEFEELDD